MSCPILDPPSISQKGRETTHQHGGWDALAQHKLHNIDLSELCRNVHVMDLETSKKVALPKGILSKRPRLSGISGGWGNITNHDSHSER